MNPETLKTMLEIGKAVNALRHRTGDNSYGSRVEQGKFQLVRVAYGKRGRSDVCPVSAPMSAPELIAHINSL